MNLTCVSRELHPRRAFRISRARRTEVRNVFVRLEERGPRGLRRGFAQCLLRRDLGRRDRQIGGRARFHRRARRSQRRGYRARLGRSLARSRALARGAMRAGCGALGLAGAARRDDRLANWPGISLRSRSRRLPPSAFRARRNWRKSRGTARISLGSKSNPTSRRASSRSVLCASDRRAARRRCELRLERSRSARAGATNWPSSASPSSSNRCPPAQDAGFAAVSPCR